MVSRKFVLANGFTIIENDGLKQKNDLQKPNFAVCPIIEITLFSVKEHKTHVISIPTKDVCLLKGHIFLTLTLQPSTRNVL